jgi:NAD(P)-dependent dehydrogenase (short-subunit alcohol dehydrogenase family)
LHRAIADIVAKEAAIDILFNNAGVNPATFEASPQGREMFYEVNTVVPYILAQEMRPLLARRTHRKIVNVSSSALLMVNTFDPETARTRIFASCSVPT